MADANLTKRIAELEAKIERLTAEAATSRPLRRRLGGKLTDHKLKSFNQPGHIIGDGNNLLYKCGGLGRGCWIYRYKVHGRVNAGNRHSRLREPLFQGDGSNARRMMCWPASV